MRALLIHRSLCLPGFVGERLAERGYASRPTRWCPRSRYDSPAVDTEFPDPRDFEVVVALGAAWSAYDEACTAGCCPSSKCSAMPTRRGFRCSVSASAASCWRPRTAGRWAAAAAGDRLVRRESDDELVPAGRWFQWHYDRWQLPAGATEIARNPQASQAFVLDRNLAVQFHPEIDEKILRGWLANGGDDDAASSASIRTRCCRHPAEHGRQPRAGPPTRRRLPGPGGDVS